MTLTQPLPKWEYACELFNYQEDPQHSAELQYMLHELSFQRKIMVDYDETHTYFKRAGLTQGLHITDADINTAYDIAYGQGCEYEWL